MPITCFKRYISTPAPILIVRHADHRTLLFREGLAVQVKPEASSPWRGPGALSGGQVALVGLALNLATQAVRPAPLYLMDEVRVAIFQSAGFYLYGVRTVAVLQKTTRPDSIVVVCSGLSSRSICS